MSKTVIMPCLCVSKYQDETYGKGMRVHNEVKPKTPTEKSPARCTVCTNVKVR